MRSFNVHVGKENSKYNGSYYMDIDKNIENLGFIRWMKNYAYQRLNTSSILNWNEEDRGRTIHRNFAGIKDNVVNLM